MKQRDLFGRRPSAPPPQRSAPEAVEPFDFEAHPDPRTTPRPDAVIPPELRLPTDDENWMPGKA
jgi:hypothetical protein